MRRVTIPYLEDHHNHPSLYAVLSGAVDLSGVSGSGEALAAIEAAAAKGRNNAGGQAGRETDRTVLAFNWNDRDVSLGSGDLTGLGPVFVCGSSLHNHLMSSEAREIYRPRYGDLVDNIDDPGWVERNLPRILTMMMEIRPVGAGDLAGFYGDLAAAGVWYAEDMLVPDAGHVRMVREAGLSGRTSLWADPAGFRSMDGDAREAVTGLKVWADGALGARTAALSAPYLDGSEGLLVYEDGEIEAFVSEAALFGKALAIHALGDRAVEQALSVLERMGDAGAPLPPVRLEHCQFITPRQAGRVVRMGLVLSMQPNFSADSTVYSDRLAPGFPERNNPFRMLVDEAGLRPGVDLLFGSDGMPSGLPEALESALFPPLESQRLSLEEFTAGYCAGGGPSIELSVDDEEGKVRMEGAGR